MRIFINEQPLDAGDGETVGESLAVYDASVADAVAAGRAYVTDGVGRRVRTDVPITGGAIFRIVNSPPRASDAGADE